MAFPGTSQSAYAQMGHFWLRLTQRNFPSLMWGRANTMDQSPSRNIWREAKGRRRKIVCMNKLAWACSSLTKISWLQCMIMSGHSRQCWTFTNSGNLSWHELWRQDNFPVNRSYITSNFRITTIVLINDDIYSQCLHKRDYKLVVLLTGFSTISSFSWIETLVVM